MWLKKSGIRRPSTHEALPHGNHHSAAVEYLFRVVAGWRQANEVSFVLLSGLRLATSTENTIVLRFVDLFSGCGGLSLGLASGGHQGLFSIEKDSMAFATFKANLIDVPRNGLRRFEWPEWLPKQACGIDELLAVHRAQLDLLAAQEIDLIAGGPPCQGFSFAGRRQADDPRNQLFTKYLKVVKIVRPTAVLLENVPGMAVAHRSSKGFNGKPTINIKGSVLERLVNELSAIGYDVEARIVNATDYGVPQKRARLIVVGLLKERFLQTTIESLAAQVFERLSSHREAFLSSLGLSTPVTASEAIGDLSILGRNGTIRDLRECMDPASAPGFLEVAYDGRRSRSSYQILMRRGMGQEPMDSMRLARHSEKVRSRFSEIIRTCRQGVCMSYQDRATFKLKKQRIHPMSADEPAPTITTLPDDIVHFSDPRILTVREYARLQSFPDWFVFKGKYTTGGDLRTKECPRYTQVGNAVPPLLGLALGQALEFVIKKHRLVPDVQLIHESRVVEVQAA